MNGLDITVLQDELTRLKVENERLANELAILQPKLHEAEFHADGYRQSWEEVKAESIEKGNQCTRLTTELATLRQKLGDAEGRILIEARRAHDAAIEDAAAYVERIGDYGSESKVNGIRGEAWDSWERFKKTLQSPAQTEGREEGWQLIAAERQRQVEKEGWSPSHDDEHVNAEMAFAAAAYILHYAGREWLLDDKDNHLNYQADPPHEEWPEDWGVKYWKPKDRISDLVRAGALIAAEIDRLKRLPATSTATPTTEPV